MRYYPVTGKFYLHWDGDDKSDYDNAPYNHPEDSENVTVADTDAEKGYVTIGLFRDNKPQGVAWQWKSERLLEGFLYGEVDNDGKFTGDEITFIYPDLLTGLHGKFRDGEVVEARAVDIVAERCQQGVKEIKLRFNKKDETVWKRVDTNSLTSPFARTMEPHERKAVYVGSSRAEGDRQTTGDGVFARRLFLPGELVTYFSGLKTLEVEMFHDNMTEQEEYEASRYYFGLYDAAPIMWGVGKDIVLDVPSQFRDVINFRTTLGHKTNHKFDPEANGGFEVVKHPLFGVIVAIVARDVIEEDEEIFVDYNYSLEDGPLWYKEAHKKMQERLETK